MDFLNKKHCQEHVVIRKIKDTSLIQFQFQDSCLPHGVIDSTTVKEFEINLDEHWKNVDMKYDHLANV